MRNAYNKTLAATGDPRAVEAELFSRIGAELSTAIDNVDSDRPGYVSAVSRNLQLWTAITADIVSDDNALPTALRSQLLALAGFVRRASFDALSKGVTAETRTMVEINHNVAGGLRRSLASGHAP